jgi:hypothetical protein
VASVRVNAHGHGTIRAGGKGSRVNSGFGGPAEGPSGGLRMLPPDVVQLVSEDASLNLIVGLGDGSADVTQGYGGWETVEVPGRRSRAKWNGVDAPAIAVPLLFDGYRSSTSVEPDIAILEEMAGLTVPLTDSGFHTVPAEPSTPRPPKLLMYALAIPHSTLFAPSARWVISELEWTDPVIRLRSTAERVRQGATLTLLLAEDDKALKRIRKAKAKPRHASVRSHTGDTYERIAARKLGSKRYGRKLAHLNGARDPSKKLPKNTLVKLPSEAELAKWKRELKL